MKFGERWQAEAKQQREQALAEKNRAENMMERIVANLLVLNDFSANLKHNISTTKT